MARKSFKNIGNVKTTLAMYVWQSTQMHNITPPLRLHIVKSVPSYSNVITKLYVIICYINLCFRLTKSLPELLNKGSELVLK